MKIAFSAFIALEWQVFPPEWIGLILFAAWVTATLRPKTLVELGTQSGKIYCAFCQAAMSNDSGTRTFAVDKWRGDEHSFSNSQKVFKTLVAHNDSRYGAFSKLLRMTFDKPFVKLAKGAIGLLHIDGLHKYEAVKRDFDTWFPKLSERSAVRFHETKVKQRDFGVHTLCVLLKREHRHPDIRDVSSDDENRQRFLEIFKRLGDGIEYRCRLSELPSKLNLNEYQLTAHRAAVNDHLVSRGMIKAHRRIRKLRSLKPNCVTRKLHSSLGRNLTSCR